MHVSMLPSAMVSLIVTPLSYSVPLPSPRRARGCFIVCFEFPSGLNLLLGCPLLIWPALPHPGPSRWGLHAAGLGFDLWSHQRTLVVTSQA